MRSMSVDVHRTLALSRLHTSPSPKWNTRHSELNLTSPTRCNTKNKQKLYTTESSNSGLATEEGSVKPNDRTSESDEEFVMTDKELRRQKLGLIIGPVWFVILMYLCFIREEKDDGFVDFVNKDPRFNENLPKDVQEKAKLLYGDSPNK